MGYCLALSGCEMRLRDLAAGSPGFANRFAQKKRAQGTPGARCTRVLVWMQVKYLKSLHFVGSNGSLTYFLTYLLKVFLFFTFLEREEA